jgi:hypothetical protein
MYICRLLLGQPGLAARLPEGKQDEQQEDFYKKIT